jgi:hypothetical protein
MAAPASAPVPEKPKDLPEFFWALANRIFRPGALAFVLMLAVGAVGALAARAWASDQQQALVDAGVAPVEAELKAHIEESRAVHVRQEDSERRTEAKVDRIDARMDQLMIAVYAQTGRSPPAPPPLVIADGGR